MDTVSDTLTRAQAAIDAARARADAATMVTMDAVREFITSVPDDDQMVGASIWLSQEAARLDVPALADVAAAAVAGWRGHVWGEGV